jgi:hypothetical protein
MASAAMLSAVCAVVAGQEAKSPEIVPPEPATPQSSSLSVAEITGPDSRWQFFQSIQLPAEPSDNEYYDFIVPVSVFDQARREIDGVSLYLGDLRIVDAEGKEVPYALRVLRPVNTSEAVPTTEFNRATTADGASELTLDLGSAPLEHNEVEVQMPGSGYRRRAVLEGSANGQEWQTLLENELIYFRRGDRELDGRTLSYPASRFRYLRLRVYQDPMIGKKPVVLSSVIVRRQLTLPGELVSTAATIEPREPTRGNGGPGSVWILDLGCAHLPCEKLLVEVGDADFSRDFMVETGGQPGSDEPFGWASGGTWTRHAGDEPRPLTTDFSDRAAGRLRLVVTDFRNPPLDLRGATVQAPARQIVFARQSALHGPLRLYYGNP